MKDITWLPTGNKADTDASNHHKDQSPAAIPSILNFNLSKPYIECNKLVDVKGKLSPNLVDEDFPIAFRVYSGVYAHTSKDKFPVHVDQIIPDKDGSWNTSFGISESMFKPGKHTLVASLNAEALYVQKVQYFEGKCN